MLVGSVGVHFNNFSMRNFLNLKAWRPYPSGDGQSLSIRAQSNGRLYQSYNISFMEPWLGGNKANSFSVSVYRSLMNYGFRRRDGNAQLMITNGASIGLGKRLEWPDAVSYTHLRDHETPEHLVCRLLLEKKNIHRTIIMH